MGQITFDEKKNSIIITNILDYPETIDEVALKYMNASQFRGIFPMTVKQIGKQKALECSVQGCITLKEYLGVGVTKRKFLSTVKWLVSLLNEWENSYLNIGNLHLQLERIFVEPLSKTLYCIYWPVFNCINEQPVYLFFQSLPYYIDFNLHEDHSYLETYKDFFNKGTDTFVKDFYKMLEDLLYEDKRSTMLFTSQIDETTSRKSETPVRTSISASVGTSARPSTETSTRASVASAIQEKLQPLSPWKGGACPVCGADNAAGAKFCQDCGANLEKLQQEAEIKAKQGNKAKIEDSLIGNSHKNSQGDGMQVPELVGGEWNGETAVLQVGAAATISTYNAYLCHTKSAKKQWITKDVFVLGKDSQSCDWILDSRVVSRKHAQIICRDGRYYVKDLNSTNYTYVNGSRILPNREIELENHTKLRFANEEFEFEIV